MDVRELLHVSITIALATITVLVGTAVGDGLGGFLAMAGILSASGSLATLAISRA